MRKPFHGKRRKVTESGGIFLRDDYQFTCRSQPLEGRLYFLDVMPIEGVKALVHFMLDFARQHG